MDFLNEVVLGNTIETWLKGIAVAVLTAGALRVVVPRLVRRVKRFAQSTNTYVDDAVVAAAAATKNFLYLVAGIYAGARLLELPGAIATLIDGVLASAVLIQIGLWLVEGYRTFLLHYRQAKYLDDPAAATSFNLIRYAGSAVIWFFVFVFVLQAWGVNVTALITGLGIGGIAIALAVQSILSDLFASLSIIFDKPFLVGDYLTIDEYGGTVESIGLKTTLLRSVSGEQLVFSNSDLLSSRIRNYGRMEERRGSFTFGIVYETDPHVVSEIPGWVKAIVESEELTRFDRCHFKSLGQSALEFETVYHMTVPDYKAFMDVQERINLALMLRLTEAGVEFAYPTQLLYLSRTGDLPADPAGTVAVDAS
ncbi:MAG: mechanosensitive ion channel family protein [Gemmatimonadota bacterium]